MSAKPLSPERLAALRLLCEAGWSDIKIGRAFERSKTVIARWRKRNGLKPLPQGYRQKIDHAQALAMYGVGASDGEIARRFGATQSGATRWRQRQGLAPNMEKFQPVDAHRKRAARKLLRNGASRRHVAETIGVCVNTITRIRKAMGSTGLRPTGLSDRAIRTQVLNDHTLERRIRRAVGANLPAEIRYEAATELYVDVLEGRLARDRIETAAASYRNRAYYMCGSKFGPRSLDAENDDSWTLSDTLADPDALQSMEAAAELAYEMDD